MKAEDVGGDLMVAFQDGYLNGGLRGGIAAVAPLIAKAERERCLTAVCTRQPLGPTIDRAETLAAIRALPDGEVGG